MPQATEKFASKESSGLVISYFGSSVAVEDISGQVFQCQLRRNQELPVVGDRVKWVLEKDNTGLIVSIEPRTSVLPRGTGHGKKKPIAANIDTLVVVMAPPPIFSEFLIDRYFVAAELLNLKVILVLNKIDLLTGDDLKLANERLVPYRNIPYQVVLSTIMSADGLKELTTVLNQQTAVLLGPSGVGKSSIIAALSQEDIRVNDVSAKGSGKHTTTATRLYHIPNGGQLIDSPGVREFHLWPVTKQEILKGFKEFLPYVKDCKFRDCSHSVEPQCAVQNAIANGKISPLRYQNYQQLLKENKQTERDN